MIAENTLRIAAEIPDHMAEADKNQQQNRRQTGQHAQQQAQPDAGGGGIELVRGLQRGKRRAQAARRRAFCGPPSSGSVRAAGGASRPAAFPRRSARARSRASSGICCGWLRIRFALVGPDGGALRLRLRLCVWTGAKRMVSAGSLVLVRRCLRIGRAGGRCGKPDSLTRLCVFGSSRFVQPPNSFIISSSEYSGSSCSAGVLFSCASSSGRLVGSIVCSMFCESTILAL